MHKLTARGQTDVGMKREHNEDYFAIDDDLGLYVVCDGMGGHASGEVASKLACENILGFVRERHGNPEADLPYDCDGAEDFESVLLSNAVQFANDRVFIEGMKDAKLEGMGTTLVAMMVSGTRMILAHVGDSRIYRYNPNDGKLELLTRDHSLLNHKIDLGELQTEDEIKNFKQGNVIVRAVGLKDEVQPEVQSVNLSQDDVFLLCSDGLSDLVDDWAIENVLVGNSDELEEAAQTFIRMANDRGGKDNITALLVRVDDDGSVAATAAAPDAHDEHVTEPTMPKVIPEEESRPVPEWLAEPEDGPLKASGEAYDDPNEWREVNDYGEGDVEDDPARNEAEDLDDDLDDDEVDAEDSDDGEELAGDDLDDDDDLDAEDSDDDEESADDDDASAFSAKGTLKITDQMDSAELEDLSSIRPLYDLAVPEQVALIALSKQLIVADGSISLSEMEELNSLAAIVGQAVFKQADQVTFPTDKALQSFLRTISRVGARQVIFDKLLEIALSDALVPSESSLLAMIAEIWEVSLPGASSSPGVPPPLPSARRTARATNPGVPVPSTRKVASMNKDGSARKLPSIIIDDDI